jgi:acyl carrier protein
MHGGSRKATEQHLSAMIASLLEGHPVGPEDNFLDLGGDSIIAIKAAALVYEYFGIDVPTATFLSPHDTIRDIANTVQHLCAIHGTLEPQD